MAKFEPITITDEQLEALDAEHDDVHLFKGRPKAPWLCVVRRPTFQETQAYKLMASEPLKKPLANVKLITAISVYPKGGSEDWKRQFDRWPFFPDGLAETDDFKEFIGIATASTEK